VRQSPQNIQNVVTYDVVVSVSNNDLSLKPGMTAASRIVTAERQDVLRVPSQALRYAPGGLKGAARNATPSNQSAVYVLRDGKPARVAVTVGLDDDSHAEIVKGDLQVGDRVITTEQRNGAAGRQTATPRLRF
jgi:HlyD family secretion protein